MFLVLYCIVYIATIVSSQSATKITQLSGFQLSPTFINQSYHILHYQPIFHDIVTLTLINESVNLTIFCTGLDR